MRAERARDLVAGEHGGARGRLSVVAHHHHVQPARAQLPCWDRSGRARVDLAHDVEALRPARAARSRAGFSAISLST